MQWVLNVGLVGVALLKLFPDNHPASYVGMAIVAPVMLCIIGLTLCGMAITLDTLFQVLLINPWQSPAHLGLNVMIAILRGITYGFYSIPLV